MSAATMTKVHDKQHEVSLGKRVIGSVTLFTIRGESAWRFIANRKDIAERFPEVAPKHGTPDEALAFINRTLGAAP